MLDAETGTVADIPLDPVRPVALAGRLIEAAAGCTPDDAMIHIRQRIIPGSRTHTGSLWEVSTEIDGKPYSATSRHGAPQALARMLVAAGIADQRVEVHSEVCVFDNGAGMIQTEELLGCIRYRSLYAMARITFEEGDRPLHRARFKERPQIAFPLPPDTQGMRFTPPTGIPASEERSRGLAAGGGTGQKCVSSLAGDVLDPSPADGHETRFCDECGDDFLPARPWSRFCSPACRLRSHRSGRNRPQFPGAIP